jgi:predicted PurR-regulated permease PerM
VHADETPDPLMEADTLQRADVLLRFGVAALLLIGCWLVLRPFMSAILFAAVIAVSSWPAYRWLGARLRLRAPAAALLASLAVVALLLGPAALLATAIGDAVPWLVSLYDEWRRDGLPPAPDWLASIPLAGDWLQAYWTRLADGAVPDYASFMAQQSRPLLLATGRAVADGLLQIALAALVLYFLYREGERLAARLSQLAARLGGSIAPALLATARHTVLSVTVGILGTALAQAMVAILGFAIAGVPNPLLLGAATFVLSMVPVGPPLIWGGAAVWLYRDGEAGMAVFMALYGLLCISAIDNVIKPLLISRGAHLPFVVTLLGVLGGLYAFGLIGLFLGPTLLALALNLAGHWLAAAATPGLLPLTVVNAGRGAAAQTAATPSENPS